MDTLDTSTQAAMQGNNPGFSTQTTPAQARDPVRTIAHILRATAIILGLCALLWILASAFVVIILAAIPAIIVALAVGVREAIWVIAVFAVAHVIEGYSVAPFVQRHTMHLPPALTLLSSVVLVAIFNIYGVLIATPLMAALMVGITRVYVEDILGDQAGKRLTVRARWHWFTPPEDTG